MAELNLENIWSQVLNSTSSNGGGILNSDILGSLAGSILSGGSSSSSSASSSSGSDILGSIAKSVLGGGSSSSSSSSSVGSAIGGAILGNIAKSVLGGSSSQQSSSTSSSSAASIDVAAIASKLMELYNKYKNSSNPTEQAAANNCKSLSSVIGSVAAAAGVGADKVDDVKKGTEGIANILGKYKKQ